MMQNSLLTKAKAFFLLIGANPLVQLLYKAGIGAAGFYYAGNQFAPTKAWAIGLAGAFVGGVVHAFDTWVLAQIAAAAPGQTPSSTPSVQLHIAKLKAMLKMVMLILAASSLFAPSAFAWDVQSKALVQNKDANRVGVSYSMTAPSSPEVDGILMPTASIAMNPFADLGTPSYGYTVDEALLIARVSDASGGHVNVSNIFGATAGFYSDLYPLIKGSGPWIVKGELGVIGPDMGTGVVPGVQAVYDFASGDRQVLVNLNIPIGVFEEDTVIKLFGL
jgi:hypothetical protein